MRIFNVKYQTVEYWISIWHLIMLITILEHTLPKTLAPANPHIVSGCRHWSQLRLIARPADDRFTQQTSLGSLFNCLVYAKCVGKHRCLLGHEKSTNPYNVGCPHNTEIIRNAMKNYECRLLLFYFSIYFVYSNNIIVLSACLPFLLPPLSL